MMSWKRMMVEGLKNPCLAALDLTVPEEAGVGASKALALLPATSFSISVRPAPTRIQCVTHHYSMHETCSLFVLHVLQDVANLHALASPFCHLVPSS